MPKLYGNKRKSGDDEFIPTLSFSSSEATGELIAISPETKVAKRRLIKGKDGGYNKYHESVQEGKPEPSGQPPVWAEKRQALCETLPYYKAYMSGAYMHDGIAKAFMVDKEVGPRDKFNEEIVIARV